MAEQDFDTLIAGDPSLLAAVETIVVGAHRRLYESSGRTWSKPLAYRWLHYEDPMPVSRLHEGVRKLRRRGATFDSQAVDKACKQALANGFSS
jgi:hypothetical protein